MIIQVLKQNGVGHDGSSATSLAIFNLAAKPAPAPAIAVVHFISLTKLNLIHAR